jgi:indolepyruvate ferredoxin oxidoreductase
MNLIIDERFLKEKGYDVYNGNELIIKGALEAGIQIASGYPGSPVAEFFTFSEKYADWLIENGFYWEAAKNEAEGAGRLNGARIINRDAMVVMKSVGLNVAMDPLEISNYQAAATIGWGGVVVVGDDPHASSTQVASSSRFLLKKLRIPILEPSTPQEVKDYVGEALELSRSSQLIAGCIIQSWQADGIGSVELYKNKYPPRGKERIDISKINVEKEVSLPPVTAELERDIVLRRLQATIRHARARTLNKILYSNGGKSKIGFVTSGLAYCYLEQALHELGVSWRFPILKLGLVYPLDEILVKDFARQVENIYVVEEKEPFIESEISLILKNAYQNREIGYVNVWGKRFPNDREGFPEHGGLSPTDVIRTIGEELLIVLDNLSHEERRRIKEVLNLVDGASKYVLQAPRRIPSYCAGCPHRGTNSVLKYLRKYPDNDFLTIPDIGCYSMSAFTPWREAHAFNAMGRAGASAYSMGLVENKKVLLMGDGTFLHGGYVSVQEAIDKNLDAIIVILYNHYVAMTGHQKVQIRDAKELEEKIKAMSRGKDVYIRIIDPNDRRGYIEELKKLMSKRGTAVLISDKECGITRERRRRAERAGRPKTEFINITNEVCENCRECTINTGCPGLTLVNTPYGEKVAIDMSVCTEDEYCAKIEACPSFEKVRVVYAGGKPQERLRDADLDDVPEPDEKVEFNDTYSIYTGAIGGMGGGLLSVILARAGAKSGYNIGGWIGHDKKGLAQRNGGVYSHIMFTKNNNRLSPVIVSGKADLIIGLDKLEGLRGLKYANANTRFVSNQTELPTIPMLVGGEEYPHDIDDKIRSRLGLDKYFGLPISELAEFYLGSKLFSNIVMLGVCYQLGLLPLDSKDIEAAIIESVKFEKEKNLRAFRFGRKLVHDKNFLERLMNNPDFLRIYHEDIWFSRKSLEEVLSEKKSYLKDYYLIKSRGVKIADMYEKLVRDFMIDKKLDEDTLKHLAIRVYDLIRWGGIDYAKKYIDLVSKVYYKDREEKGFAATIAVIENLYKVMAIKDELWVSELLLSREKLERDRIRYNVNVERGDRIEYIHLTEPQIVIRVGRRLGKIISFLKRHSPNLANRKVELDVENGVLKIKFVMNTRNWQLRIVRRMKFLRKYLFRHRKEEEFRDWYIERVINYFLENSEQNYGLAVEFLKMPLGLNVPGRAKGVTGFREVIYPKMDLARRTFENLTSSHLISELESLGKK